MGTSLYSTKIYRIFLLWVTVTAELELENILRMGTCSNTRRHDWCPNFCFCLQQQHAPIHWQLFSWRNGHTSKVSRVLLALRHASARFSITTSSFGINVQCAAIKMSVKLSTVEKRELDKFSKFLALKTVQIIVQSRVGHKVITKCSPKTSQADWVSWFLICNQLWLIFMIRRNL